MHICTLHQLSLSVVQILNSNLHTILSFLDFLTQLKKNLKNLRHFGKCKNAVEKMLVHSECMYAYAFVKSVCHNSEQTVLSDGQTDKIEGKGLFAPRKRIFKN